MLATTFFAAIATGVTALVARHTGAREPEPANRILHQGYLLGLALGVIVAALALGLAKPIVVALRAPVEVIAPAASYLRIAAAGFVAAAWLFIGNAALRGAGDTRSPMLIMLVVNLVNIVAGIYTRLRFCRRGDDPGGPGPGRQGSGPCPRRRLSGTTHGDHLDVGDGGALLLLRRADH